MLQTSSCEDVRVASVSLRAAVLLPTHHSEVLNNGSMNTPQKGRIERNIRHVPTLILLAHWNFIKLL